jgi:glycosyltransferase involved in cell wall biosynthesis
MRARGFDWTLVTGSCAAGEQEMSYLIAPDDPIVRVPEMARPVSPWRDAAALWRLYRLFRRLRPDIVHTHTAKAGMLGRVAARLAGVPVVLHTFHGNVLSAYFPRPVNWLLRGLERALAAITDTICVLSAQQAEEIAGRFAIAPPDRVRILPLGIDLEQWKELAPPPRGPDLVVGWLGRLVAVKDIPLLCAVIREAVREIPQIRFLLAGDGPERPLVERLVAETGERCRFLGWQQDVQAVIGQCHALILTSRNEGTPVSLIQAMAAGRTFVSTPAGGVVDLVDPAPVAGPPGCAWYRNAALCPPDPEAFVRVLRTLAGDRQRLESMNQASREFAVRFDFVRLVQDLEELYAELLARRRGAGWDLSGQHSLPELAQVVAAPASAGPVGTRMRNAALLAASPADDRESRRPRRGRAKEKDTQAARTGG